MPHINQLPSGRWRATVRARRGRRLTQTFDYAFEAEAWADEVAAQIRAAQVRAAHAAATAIPLAAPAPPPIHPVSSGHLVAVDDAPALAAITPPAPAVVDADAIARAASPAPTVTEHGRDWYDRKRASWAPKTATSYNTNLRAISKYPIAALPIDQLRRIDVERWVAAMAEAGTGQPTIQSRLVTLRVLCNDAVAHGIIPADPTAGIKPPKKAIRAMRTMTDAERVALLGAAGPDLSAQIMLAADAGLRWGEVLGLPADAVLLDQRTIIVRQKAEQDGTITAYPKGGNWRQVPLTDELVTRLRPLVAAATLARGRDGLVFGVPSGRAKSYSNWYKSLWAPARAAAGIVGQLRFHDLRHTYGSRLAAAGVPRSEIAEVMGHADESTTRGYIHVNVHDDVIRAALRSA